MAQKFARLAASLARQTQLSLYTPGLRAVLEPCHAAGRDMLGISQMALCQCFRAFHTSSSLLESLNVQVPSMGDSITEGTIAAVLKQQGESVAEDETILQIETDKVTIDVRAPKAGKLEAVLVRYGGCGASAF